MTINSVTRSSMNTDMLLTIRSELDTLQRQLGTGQKSNSFSGLGDARATSLNARAELASIENYLQTIQRTDVTLSIMTDTVSRLDELALEVKGETLTTSLQLDGGDRTTAQITSETRLREMVSLLNSDVDGRFLFSGLSSDTKPVVPLDRILNGQGGEAGFVQVLDERSQADLGGALSDPSLTGRLTLDTTATVFSLTENGNDAFGFQLDVAAGASSSSPNITVTGPAGAPTALSFDVTGPVDEGDTIRFNLQLPDGTDQLIVLSAASSRADGDYSFVVDADPLVTAANLGVAVTDIIDELARTELAAASATRAGMDFFDNDPPLRVVPDPVDGLAGATSSAADPTTTVRWYQGEDSVLADRETATSRIDDGLIINYGARANEDALRTSVREAVVFTTVRFDVTDPTSEERYQALAARVRDNLDDPTAATLPRSVALEVGTASALMNSTKERLTSERGVVQSILDQTDGISQEEVATRLLNLQTRLEASYTVTAILRDLSLTNFLR
ncbi:MAG: hypothetical protein AAGH60_03030 [Pseudomonadota bacterium]